MVAQVALKPTMFSDSLLESSRGRSRRSWATLTSFAFEMLAIGLLLLLPLWKTVGLPAARTLSTPIALGHVAPAAAVPHMRSPASPTHPSTAPTMFVQPGRIAQTIDTSIDDEPIGNASSDPIGSAVGSPVGSEIANVLSGSRPVMPAMPPPRASVPAFRTSKILEGNLINKVQPSYPPLARAARIQGAVILYAMISKAGTIDNLRLISGHPMLSKAAIDAVSQWRYRPYILNGEPIEVETQITVNFTLGGN